MIRSAVGPPSPPLTVTRSLPHPAQPRTYFSPRCYRLSTAGRWLPLRRARFRSCWTRYRASRSTPWTVAEAIAYWKSSPMNISPGTSADTPLLVARQAVRPEHRQVDPAVVRIGTGAPHDRRHLLEYVAFRGHGPAVADPFDPTEPHDACRVEVREFVPGEGQPAVPNVRDRLAAHRRTAGEHVLEQEHDHRGEQTSDGRVDVDRHLTRVPSGEQGPVCLGRFESDVGARVGGSDDQHGPVGELSGVRYSIECSWVIDGSSSAANDGRRGVVCMPAAPTTWSARQSPALVSTTNPWSSRDSLVTRTPVRSGSS